MARLRYKKMSYFDFINLSKGQMSGHFKLTLKHDKSKVVTEGFWENGVMLGGFKDYMAWDCLLFPDSSKVNDIYKANPLSQIGFYGKEENLEGEFFDFEYVEEEI